MRSAVCVCVCVCVCTRRALGKEPIFVDLEADPKIDRDNPPDLAKYTIAPPPKPDTPATGPAAAPATPEHAPAAAPAAKPAAAAPAAGASGKKQAKAAKGAAGGAGGGVSLFEQHQALTSVHEATQVLLDKVRYAMTRIHMLACLGGTRTCRCCECAGAACMRFDAISMFSRLSTL